MKDAFLFPFPSSQCSLIFHFIALEGKGNENEERIHFYAKKTKKRKMQNEKVKDERNNAVKRDVSSALCSWFY